MWLSCQFSIFELVFAVAFVASEIEFMYLAWLLEAYAVAQQG
jgi:hypothetical protein